MTNRNQKKPHIFVPNNLIPNQLFHKLLIIGTSLIFVETANAKSEIPPDIETNNQETTQNNEGNGGRNCFHISTIRDFKAIGRNHLYVRAGGRDGHYLFTLMRPSTTLRHAETLAFESSPSSFICENSIEYVTALDSNGFDDRVPITNILKVNSKDEAKEIANARDKEEKEKSN